MPFNLVGHARAVANMSIGQITLDPINFDVPSSLNGLRGLDGLVRIESVDVLGGSEGAISLGIDGACSLGFWVVVFELGDGLRSCSWRTHSHSVWDDIEDADADACRNAMQ